jgi:hypothetical protein
LELNKKIDNESSYKNHKTRKSYDSAMAKNPSFFGFIETPVAHKFFELKENGVTKRKLSKIW